MVVQHCVHVFKAVGQAQYPAAERHVVGYGLVHYSLCYFHKGGFALHDYVRRGVA